VLDVDGEPPPGEECSQVGLCFKVLRISAGESQRFRLSAGNDIPKRTRWFSVKKVECAFAEPVFDVPIIFCNFRVASRLVII
jgi:hypothetical protein